MESAIVVTAALAVEAGELVEPNTRLIAVSDAELEDVELVGERTPGSQFVPDLEQALDELASAGGVARVALPTGERLLVLMAAGALPETQRTPIERIEAPDHACAPRPPG